MRARCSRLPGMKQPPWAGSSPDTEVGFTVGKDQSLPWRTLPFNQGAKCNTQKTIQGGYNCHVRCLTGISKLAMHGNASIRLQGRPGPPGELGSAAKQGHPAGRRLAVGRGRQLQKVGRGQISGASRRGLIMFTFMHRKQKTTTQFSAEFQGESGLFRKMHFAQMGRMK